MLTAKCRLKGSVVSAVAVIVMGMAAAVASADDKPQCDGLLPKLPAVSAVQSRPITLSDLVTLRDIGPLGPWRIREPILSLSPDGRTVAFQLRRADLKSNRYCLGMVLIDLTGVELPRLVDRGGDLVLGKTEVVGFGPHEAGFAEVITPKWSPDGRSLAYLRRQNGVTQVWRVGIDGSAAGAVTRSDLDVTSFAWSRTGDRIAYATVGQSQAVQAHIRDEYDSGYLYDDRFDPALSNRPLARDPMETSYFTVDLATMTTAPATADQREALKVATTDPIPGAVMSSQSVSGNRAWTMLDPKAPFSATAKLYRQIDHNVTTCSTCGNVADLWWAGNGNTLFFLQKETERPKLGLYGWRSTDPQPKLILQTDNALSGCVVSGPNLICAEEEATRPRRLVSISLETGHIDDLFDPNPEYRDLELGAVRSLRWKNAFGLDTFGKLVLPAHATPGTRLPLIVVGYQSEGFLRGGVGDDYPIQLFAAHGYAVLSYERPPVYGLVRGKTEMEAMQLDTRDWTDYRNVLSSIETEVSALIAEGIVDRDRIGLTGFSNGASVAQFAMVNSKLFRAYAVSHCCEEPVGVVTITGPVGNRYFSQMGYPKLTDSPSTFWVAMSIRLNAAKFNAPVLMQLSDEEYLGALEGFQALKEQGKPAEMYVFPDEHHIKWQPAHRAAQYQRSLDWFDFWLRNIEDPDPSKADQYQRWRTLREGLSKQ